MAANTITGLVPTIYEAMDLVSREVVGFIPAVSRDAKPDQRVGLNQVIRSPVTPALVAQNITPSNVSPDTTGSTIGFVDLTMTKARAVPFNFSGEETASLDGSPNVTPYGTIKRDLIAQALRTLVNEIETDLAALARTASRAYGTAGTAPFATAADLSDIAQTLKILQDNGCPQTDLRMVLNTTSSAQLRAKQSQLFRVNEAGTDDLLRRGDIGQLMRFAVGESAGLSTFTKGTGTSYTSSAAGFAIGTTSIPIITGSGTVLAGDVVTFAGDANKYVVATGVAAPGTIVLQGPGLKQALPASAQAMTIGGNYTPNCAFHRGAFQLAARLPALPEGGDAADDRMVIVDPVTGLPFEFAVYRQYRQVRWEVALAWGVTTVASRHAAMLLS
jgi:hypothetical protein